ncbi:MAG: peptidoglycan DD-metalloendopeptidase family protein [Niameybacter sp.]|uniref:peptidoglycan DD-metalloendopeptidase family protein n=1 Tax=Niameybacter sp. TaxID=2033640 RepID=UPI002FC7F312
MNKLKNFTRKYGFYLAVGLVSVSAIAAAVVLSNNAEPVASENGAYIGDVADDALDMTDSEMGDVDIVPEGEVADVQDATTDNVVPGNIEQEATDVVEETPSVQPTDKNVEDELAVETFSTTTADANEAPFFAEGDTMLWPVEGNVIVPFRDDSTQHWYSTALEQTMRTYGVCIGAQEGAAIKAPAKGVIVDITEDATTLDSMKLVGNVGQVIVIDHGNGYTSELGIQGGRADKDLLGQTVDAMQVIGTAGTPTGPFADLGSNVYLQVKHNDNIVDPTTILGYHESVAGVDMGHIAD